VIQSAQTSGVPREIVAAANTSTEAAAPQPALTPLSKLSQEEVRRSFIDAVFRSLATGERSLFPPRVQVGMCLGAVGLELFVSAFQQAGIDGAMLAQVIMCLNRMCSNVHKWVTRALCCAVAKAEASDVAELVEGAPPELSEQLQVFVQHAQVRRCRPSKLKFS